MNCDEIKELLSAYIDNECSKQEKQEINEHLKSCTLCMKEYESLTALLNKISAIDEQEIPKGLHDDIMHKIHVMSPKKNNILPKIKRSYSIVAAAIIICVIFGYLGTGMVMKLAVKDSANEYTTTNDTASSEQAKMMITSEINEGTSNESQVNSSVNNEKDDNSSDKEVQTEEAVTSSNQIRIIDTYDSDGTSSDNCETIIGNGAGSADDVNMTDESVSVNYNDNVINTINSDANNADNTDTTDINQDKTLSIGYANDNYGDCITQSDINEDDTVALNQTTDQSLDECELLERGGNYSASEALSGTNNADTASADTNLETSSADTNIDTSFTDNDTNTNTNTDTAADEANTITFSTDTITDKAKADNSSDLSNTDNQEEEGVNGTTIIVVILAALILLVPATLLTLTRRKRPK